jgi:tRNA pseudouridine55 synthase
MPISDFSTSSFWINLDKPANITSAKAVAIVKRFTKAKKVGHGGTLDPFATGILPIAVNKATKTSQQIMDASKKYYFEISWGEFRDTDDIEGKVTETSEKRPTNNEIFAILPKFIGKITQTPSKFSAIKINGQRAYDLARKNIEFEIKPREIEIFSLKFLENNEKIAKFEVECSKGTYIRSLARDLSKELGSSGYVSKLIRLQVGNFLYKNRIPLDLLKHIITYRIALSNGSYIPLEDVLKN